MENNKNDYDLNLENVSRMEIKNQLHKFLWSQIKEKSTEKSKLKTLLELDTEVNYPEQMNYITDLTRTEVSIFMKARSRMLNLSDNFRSGNSNNVCRACRLEPETQRHVLKECVVLHSNNVQDKVTELNQLPEDPQNLKKKVWQIYRLIERLHKYPVSSTD